LNDRAEFNKGNHKKGGVDEIKDDGPHREEVFDKALSFEGQKTHGRQYDENADHVGDSEVIPQNDSGSRSDDGKHEKYLYGIDDLEQKPERPEQFLEEGSVILGFELPAEFEGYGQYD